MGGKWEIPEVIAYDSSLCSTYFHGLRNDFLGEYSQFIGLNLHATREKK